jgi:hemerythrin-like metal-binding protein
MSPVVSHFDEGGGSAMTTIEWRPEFATGIPEVDHEHRELIGWIDRTLALSGDPTAAKSAVIGMLGEIYAKISAHFALEERVMRDRHYDRFNDHKADHERLLDDIRGIMDHVEGGGSVVEEYFATRLTEWFGLHFRTHDARFHKALPPA